MQQHDPDAAGGTRLGNAEWDRQTQASRFHEGKQPRPFHQSIRILLSCKP